MKIESSNLIPISQAVHLTLLAFGIALALFAVSTSYAIWIQGADTSKFGPWGTLLFALTFVSAIIGIPFGILLIGNIVSAIILNKAFTLFPIMVSFSFVLWLAIYSFCNGTPQGQILLFGIPAACAAVTVLGSAMERALQHPED